MRNKVTVQRRIASETRQRETEEKMDDFSKIPYFGDSACRDERVVEREGQLYKDTQLLDAPSRRKRVKFSDQTKRVK